MTLTNDQKLIVYLIAAYLFYKYIINKNEGFEGPAIQPMGTFAPGNSNSKIVVGGPMSSNLQDAAVNIPAISAIQQLVASSTPTTQESVQAVNTLTTVSASTTAVSPQVAESVAQTALANIPASNVAAAAAVEQLKAAATVAAPAPVPDVVKAAQTAVNAITTPVATTPQESAKAVNTLSTVATSTSSVPPVVATTIAKVALENIPASNKPAIEAVKKITEDATKPSPASPAKVEEASITAVKAINKKSEETMMKGVYGNGISYPLNYMYMKDM